MARKVLERECRVRFALRPLWERAQRQLSEDEQLTWEGLARMLGTTRECLRYAERRGVNCYDADRWALKLGKFPNDIWPEYYDDILELVEAS